MARPWVCGGYQWAGIEHRGEALWPRLCSQSGAIDLYLNRKDAFYQNQSYWLSTPMLHILPHWNWQGREGEPIDVWVYTNCQEVELLLNGKSLGRQSVAPITHAAWSVPYEPGALEARGYTDGAEVCHERIETTGAPVALRLRLESDGVRADGRDAAIITCDCVDAQGRHVPDAAPLVQFDSSELGASRAPARTCATMNPYGRSIGGCARDSCPCWGARVLGRERGAYTLMPTG